MTLPSSGVGNLFRLAPSSFRTEKSLNVTHATDPSETKTLCGRDASKWTQEVVQHNGPDCNKCLKVWYRLGGDEEGTADGY